MGGHKGYKVVGPNGNSIFLPAAGNRDGSFSDLVGSLGEYWSRTLTPLTSDAEFLFFVSDAKLTSYGSRYLGRTVRPVRQ